MKLKRLIITTTFIILATTTTLTLTDASSRKISKIVIEENQKNVESNLSIIAHRGFSSIEIENTKEAIEEGFKSRSTSGVEIDARQTKDNEIIIFHNENINDKEISNTNLSDLKEEKITANFNYNLYIESLLDDKSGNLIRERMKLLQNKESSPMTLEEALKIHKNYPDKHLIIELKFDERDPKPFYEKVYNLIKKHHSKNIIIQSDNYENLINMKKEYNDLEYHLIIKKDNYDKIHKQDLDGYVIRKNLIDYADIKDLLNNNKKVSIWTINSYYEFEKITNKLQDIKNQVQYITNYPDALRTWNNLKTKNQSKQKIKK